ncbi:copper-translocating P-type ATPase [Pasteurellaceae bacterium RH1A]|nr:copper-translocating P-type ATPase [Pasteurellaceae bacterium RH1A]
MQNITLNIAGMHCQACASRIEKVLNKKPFVETASVNFATEQAQISFNSEQASSQQLIEIIEKTGFSASLLQEQAVQKPEKAANWRLILLLTINIPFLIGMLGMLFNSHALMLPPLWQFGLASLVQLWLALPFYRSAIASIKGGLANMDVLVSSGTLIIYLYSTAMLFLHGEQALHHIYFEASVMVIGFVSLGKFLEARTKRQSLNSIGLLLELTPQKVSKQVGETWQEVALNEVKIGDVLRANTGERICADGLVLSGSGWTDESHLTGESRPENKLAGSRVLAGSLVSDGSLTYQAQGLGSQTLLGDLTQALAQAQGSKAPIARFADKVAGVFVPVVMSLSFLTFILTWWLAADPVQALVHSVAVLVIACPCALGLATPASIMVGMGRASRAGIWFKDAAALERSAQVDTVILDKTGTLTEGKPQVAASLVLSKLYDENQLLQITASLEQHANHPLAQALVAEALAKNLPLLTACGVESQAGQGLEGDIPDLGRVKVGQAAYCGLVLPDKLDPAWQLGSIVAVAVNDEPIGAFALVDSLKPDSLKAVQALQKMGIEVQVFSGDQQSVVDFIAQDLGIKQAYCKLSPRDKAEKIAQLQASGRVVAMVGDGINDAPALAQADVSFAMKNGAHVAEQTASATLMQASVSQLVTGLNLARATLTNIKQNLFFALIYNVIGIPLAAFGLLSPVIAGAAMALSSVSVLANALRLKKGRSSFS